MFANICTLSEILEFLHEWLYHEQQQLKQWVVKNHFSVFSKKKSSSRKVSARSLLKEPVSWLSIWNLLTLKLWETEVEYIMSKAAPKSQSQDIVKSVYISVYREVKKR